MNIRFSYTIGDSEQTWYGKYYGYTPGVASHDDFLDAIFPSLQQCYSIQHRDEITLSILPHYSPRSFSDKDPLIYDFVYCNTSSPHFYFKGKRMNKVEIDSIFKDPIFEDVIDLSNDIKIETDEIEKRD